MPVKFQIITFDLNNDDSTDINGIEEFTKNFKVVLAFSGPIIDTFHWHCNIF